MTPLEEAVKEINYALPVRNRLVYLNCHGKEAVETKGIVLWHSDRDRLIDSKSMSQKDNYKSRLIGILDELLLYLKLVKDGIFNSMEQ